MTKKDNFHIFRLLAAASVLVGHAYILFGHKPPMLVGAPISRYGVFVFFIISGYLVAQSWDRDPNIGRFLARRVLRLLPALIAVVLISTFLMGTLVTSLPRAEYLSHSVTINYLSNIALYVRYSLPGVFASNPYPNVVNGSLWTLPVEFVSYLTVPAIALCFGFRKIASATFVVVVLCGCYVYTASLEPASRVILYGTDLSSAAYEIGYFVAGSLCWHARNCIKRQELTATVALAIYLFLIFVSHGSAIFLAQVAECFLLAYAVVTFGESKFILGPSVERYGDFSYGLYLYSFPITQLIARCAPSTGPYLATLFTAVAALLCAIASWHLIEKQALNFKPKKPEVRRPLAAHAAESDYGINRT